MATVNEKLFKTMSYAVIALCSIILFGNASQVGCGRDGCNRYAAASIAFGVVGFVISAVMLVFWFIAEELASKICLPISNVLFIWLSVTVGLVFQTEVVFARLIIFYGLVLALLLSVYNWNNANFKLKLVSEVKEPTSDAPPVAEEAEQA